METVHAVAALSGWVTAEDVRVVLGWSRRAAEELLTELAADGDLERRGDEFRVAGEETNTVADLEPIVTPDES